MIALLAAVLIGLYAPPSAANVLGVQALDPRAQPAATEIVRQLRASLLPRPMAIAADPGASDCAAKPYAAAANIVPTVERTGNGWYVDLGLILVDCAGWNVNEWHEALSLVTAPSDADYEKLGMALLLRLRTWMREQPVLAHSLFTKGLAYDPAVAAPMYLYALFKTNDGYMRAYVRPGGPAYAAGMRTNDIVDKIDGRFWWEYGTYQSQLRAFDGKPHTYDLTRGKVTFHVMVADPVVPA